MIVRRIKSVEHKESLGLNFHLLDVGSNPTGDSALLSMLRLSPDTKFPESNFFRFLLWVIVVYNVYPPRQIPPKCPQMM